MLMKFIKIEWNEEWRGFWLDPSSYLAELPGLAEKLPAGAREFATQDEHYDFTSPRCVKDLAVCGMSAGPREEYDLDVEFSPNEWKHESGLTIRYAKIRRLDISVRDPASGLHGIGALQLDEILPLDNGCSHRIAFTGGEFYVECADLRAEWTRLPRGPGPMPLRSRHASYDGAHRKLRRQLRCIAAEFMPVLPVFLLATRPGTAPCGCETAPRG